MKGYPKCLNSKDDYLYVKDNFSRDEWAGDFQALLDSVKDWFFVEMLESEEAGLTDDTHKVVVNEEGEGDNATKTYAQYELKENPAAKIFRLGFTTEEVEGYLAEA